jgi:hypothetical protein
MPYDYYIKWMGIKLPSLFLTLQELQQPFLLSPYI